MIIFTCEDTFEGILTCVHDAWSSRVGHKNLRLALEPVYAPELFVEYRHIPSDSQKARKMIAAIQKKISPAAYRAVYTASLASSPEKADIIYRFLVHGFYFGSRILDMLGDAPVMALFQLQRSVQNEAHSFQEFTRFSFIPPQIYFAVIEPKCDILPLLAPHFADRMPSEYFLIADKKRLTAAVHSKDEDYYLTRLSKEELIQMEEANPLDPFISLWKAFFRSTGIAQRKNPLCQRTLLSLWYRTHMTEFQ